MADLSKYTDENIIDVLSSDAEAELRNRGYDYGWFKKDKFVGCISILVNPAFKDLVKIGYADDVQKRLKTLNGNSGLPDPFHCYAVYKVRKRLEDLRLHDLLDSLDSTLRHSKNREFFEMDADKAYGVLSAIAQINGDEEQLIKNPFHDDYFDNNSSVSGSSKSHNFHSSMTTVLPKKKRSRLTFKMLNIPIGSSLVYTLDNLVVVKTVDDVSTVSYKGTSYTLSGLVTFLKNGGSWQGSDYFMFNGVKLTTLRKRLEQ